MHFWDLLHRWDQILTLFLNQIHNPATDQFMVFMSDRAAWFPMYAFVAFCLVWRLGWKKGLISIVCVALTLLACDQTANLLKYSVARLRPCYSSYMLFGGLHVLETRGSLHDIRLGYLLVHEQDICRKTLSWRRSCRCHHRQWLRRIDGDIRKIYICQIHR